MSRIFDDNYVINMEPKNGDSHSMTPEELAQTLEMNSKLAADSERNFRRQYIISLLVHNKIDINSVNIEAILDGEIPEWFNTLDRNIDYRPSTPKDDNCKYYRLSNNNIIKINNSTLTGYILDIDNKEWVVSPTLFLDFENGNLRVEEISFNDFYPTKSIEENRGKQL